MRRKAVRNQRGAVAVEFALVAPFVLLLLFGMVTAALAYSDHLSVTNAVREGARYGAAIDYSPSPSTWASSVKTRVEQVYFNSGSQITDAQICVKLIDSSGSTITGASSLGASCGSAPTAPTMAAGSCAVMVWVTKPAKISLIISADLSFNIGAQSVAYYGRTVDPTCTAG